MDEAQQRDESPREPEADSLGQIIDEVCDEFEAGWKRGERPRIEDFLAHVGEEHRSELLSHLLAVELYWRQRNSESPTPEEYGQRFPEDWETVARQFQADGQWPSAANAEVETVFIESQPQSTVLSEGAREFGNYRLLEELGRGGMGIVYRAWQPSADRYVALKLIRRDRFESLPRARQTSVIHRFEHEAQAAGRIEHDHIVTVYEVGEIEGEHFFSMRYVEGQSLTDILKGGPIGGRRAAGYLEPVARAVHEAHLHGILHRDLKPQNILIDGKTDRGLVVDFGLAKLAEGAEDMTEAGDVMGTPPYMSPEQATDSSRVTALSDVYALGATLYHAISGRPPFQGMSVLETIHLVAEQAPMPPRQIDPQIDRDLDTICLKCLEKDPAQRYPSAEALADELRRYLNHEPIEARPLGALGRGVRWCRRYPVVASLLCCTIVFFMAALVASIVGYVQTSRALVISERNSRRAQDTVDWFFTRVSEESLLNQPGLQPLRKELLEQALSYYEVFVEERGDDPTVRDELAMNAYRLGRITEQLGSIGEAEKWYRRALKMQEELLAEQPQNSGQQRKALGDTLNAMGGVFLAQGKLAEAEVSFQHAARQREELVRDVPENFEWQRKLANSYMNLGVVARESGDPGEAQKRFIQAQALRYEILERESGNGKTRRDLAMGCYNLGNLHASADPPDTTAALTNYREGHELFEELLIAQPDDLTTQYRTALTARLCGDVLTHLGRQEEARQPYLRAVDLMRLLAYANPRVPDYRFELAGVLMNLGTLDGDGETELGYCVEARWFLEGLCSEYEQDLQYKDSLADTLYMVGNLTARTGDQESALPIVGQSLELYEELSTGESGDQTDRFQMATAARLYGDLLGHFERTEESQEPYRRALGLMRQLLELDPNFPEYRCALAGILMNFGLAIDDDTETANSFAEAHEILEELSTKYQDTPQYKRDFAAVLCAIGNLEARTGDQASALVHVRQGRQHLEELCQGYPGNGEYARLLEEVKQRESVIGEVKEPDGAGESRPGVEEEQ